MVILNNDLIVEVSQNNYTLILDKHKQDKKGNPVYETLGYFGTLAGAVYGAREYCIKKKLSENAYELRDAIAEIQRANREFLDMLRKVTGECDE